MSTTYRGVVRTNEYRLRDMISPGVRVEAARGSERRLREALGKFVDLMRGSVPHPGASAWFEVTDRHGRSVATYEGAPSGEWRGTSLGHARVPAGGVWTLVRADSELRRLAPREVRAR